jgi:hypothetical protein
LETQTVHTLPAIRPDPPVGSPVFRESEDDSTVEKRLQHGLKYQIWWDFNGVFMDVHGLLMDFHGFQWIFMDSIGLHPSGTS